MRMRWNLKHQKLLIYYLRFLYYYAYYPQFIEPAYDILLSNIHTGKKHFYIYLLIGN